MQYFKGCHILVVIFLVFVEFLYIVVAKSVLVRKSVQMLLTVNEGDL